MRASTEAEIWQRLIPPREQPLSREAAESLLGIAFSPEDRGRMSELAGRAANDELTEAEAQELESYRRVGYVLDLIHSRARRVLKPR